MKKESYFIEFNGEHWQSVFPEKESEKSQLHTTSEDGINYMTKECGIPIEKISIID